MIKSNYLKKSEKRLLLLILAIGIVLSSLAYLVAGHGITRSTIKREKLKVTKEFNKDCVKTDTDYLMDVSHTAETLKAFYEDTGVQPYVLVVGKQGFGVESATEEYLKENRLKSNEMLFVYERIEPKKGIATIITGDDAGKVIDKEARNIFNDYMEKYVNEIPSLDACITKTFYDTAEVIMGNPKIPIIVFPLVIMVVDIVVLLLVFYEVIYKERKKRFEKRKTRTDELKYRGY